MSEKIVRIDEIKWWEVVQQGSRAITPICPEHNLRLAPIHEQVYRSGQNSRMQYDSEVTVLECAEGPHNFNLPRPYGKEKQYVMNRIDAKIFQGMQVIDLDGELTPIAKEKIKDDKYFVTAQLMESKRGLQLAVYAGEKGKEGKTQIFIEPDVKRLAFDQKDLHPCDVFVGLKATFDDGSSHEMKKGEIKE